MFSPLKSDKTTLWKVSGHGCSDGSTSENKFSKVEVSESRTRHGPDGSWRRNDGHPTTTLRQCCVSILDRTWSHHRLNTDHEMLREALVLSNYHRFFAEEQTPGCRADATGMAWIWFNSQSWGDFDLFTTWSNTWAMAYRIRNHGFDPRHQKSL